MISGALHKLAGEIGLKTDGGMAYGYYQGYAVSMADGMNTKYLGVSAVCRQGEQVAALREKLSSGETKKKYRISETLVEENQIIVVFQDYPGTMKRYREFLEWFLPQLPEYGFDGGLCPICGLALGPDAVWKRDGIALHVHPGCAESAQREREALARREQDEMTGSYGLGAAGAFLGAALGALIWALVLYMGYVASIVGFVIGLLAYKGYRLFRGRPGRGQFVIISAASVFGVALGNLICEAGSMAWMIHKGEIYGAVLSDLPKLMLGLMQDGEYVSAVRGNFLVGLLFAFFGVGSLLWRLYLERKAGKTKMKDLK